MSELKSHYSAQELVDLSLTSLPKTKKAILTMAKREDWQFQVRKQEVLLDEDEKVSTFHQGLDNYLIMTKKEKGL